MKSKMIFQIKTSTDACEELSQWAPSTKHDFQSARLQINCHSTRLQSQPPQPRRHCVSWSRSDPRQLHRNLLGTCFGLSGQSSLALVWAPASLFQVSYCQEHYHRVPLPHQAQNPLCAWCRTSLHSCAVNCESVFMTFLFSFIFQVKCILILNCRLALDETSWQFDFPKVIDRSLESNPTID